MRTSSRPTSISAAGGSAPPAELLAGIGIDLRDRAIWDTAFGELERMIGAAEAEGWGSGAEGA